MTNALTRLAVSEEHVNELPVEPIWIGIGTFGLLVLLLLITLQFNKDR